MRASWTITLAILLALGAAGALATAASGEASPGCGPVASKTLRSQAGIRVYRLPGPRPPFTERIYACRSAGGRAWRLSPFGPHRRGGYTLKRHYLRLSGLWVGGLFHLAGVDTYHLAVRARNLATGALDQCPVGRGGHGSWRLVVPDLVMSRHGSFAWISDRPGRRGGGEGGLPYGVNYTPPAPTRLLATCTAGEYQLLDSSGGVDLHSLQLHGSHLSWTDLGEPRFASLP